MRRVVAALCSLIVTVVLVGVPAPASAALTVEPIGQRATDPGKHTVVLAAPDDAWGIRVVARAYARGIDRLRIRTGRGLTCEGRVQVTCIRVEIGSFTHPCGTDPRWRGCASIGADPGIIWLDEKTLPADRPWLVCHELGHALGLRHHARPGCLGLAPRTKRPTAVELRALNQAYTRAG